MTPISVCIITKNEERHMEEFLKRLRPYDWEIVVVDTGSTDRTREIAEKYADKVVDFVWVNDFSAARNFSITHASHDYILVLDCDEYLAEVDLAEVCRLMKEQPEAVGRIERRNHFSLNETSSVVTEDIERLFRKDLFHYKFPIHEQIMHKSGQEHPSYKIPLSTEHYGYDLSEEEKAAKAKRNNDLLFKQLESEPDNAYVLFQIGQSFFMINDYESAYPYFKKSLLCEERPIFEYVPTLYVSYGYCLLHTNRLEEGMKLLEKHSYFEDYADFCCMAGNTYLRNNQPIKAMGEFIKAMNCSQSSVDDAKFNIPVYNIGYIFELLGDYENALLHYRRCNQFPMADEKIGLLEAQLSSAPEA